MVEPVRKRLGFIQKCTERSTEKIHVSAEAIRLAMETGPVPVVIEAQEGSNFFLFKKGDVLQRENGSKAVQNSVSGTDYLLVGTVLKSLAHLTPQPAEGFAIGGRIGHGAPLLICS